MRSVREGLVETEIALPLVSAEQTDLLGNRLIYEGVECAGAGVLDHTGNNVTLARDGANAFRVANGDATIPQDLIDPRSNAFSS